MTYVITEPCIDVREGSCVDVCPVDCIQHQDGVDRMLYINPAECIDCGACESTCPVNAIYPEDAVPAKQERFVTINALWFDNFGAARAQVNRYKPA